MLDRPRRKDSCLAISQHAACVYSRIGRSILRFEHYLTIVTSRALDASAVLARQT